ncbi:MAG: fibrobacter succinogenes major paralogous domain-containing protein [Bacteroidales bacterium]|nr:fibrobacter succinogenes major paralogous domain-containing protein [Bacteroidales bacterium]
MKSNLLKSVMVLLTFTIALSSVWAQTPQKMSYQAVIRDNSNTLVTNTQVGMRISILEASASGAAVYTETQTPTTNANGLVSVEIGGQTGFNAIDWANNIYFIKTETDPDGGTNYSITGTSQLLSVPYALHANEVDPSVPVGTTPGEMQYWNGTAWVTVAAGNEGDIMTFVNNTPTWVGESTVGTVENPTTGRIWMDRNLGASQVAESLADEDAYGDYYQWGRAADGHEKRTSGTTTTLSYSDTPMHGDFIVSPYEPYDWRSPQNDDLWQGVNGINNPCPSGYRVPTEAEWDSEMQSWSSQDAAGAFASPLKLTAAGYRYYGDGEFYLEGTDGSYWTSTVMYTGTWGLFFNNSYVDIFATYRSYGFPVRCIKD